MDDEIKQPNIPPLIVLFDGECGLCNSSVNFILARDPGRRFRFASLQSQAGRDLLVHHRLDPDALDTIVLIEGERVYLRSNAVLRIAVELPEPWPLVGVAVFIPEPLRNAAYDYVAEHRRQWFKSSESCRTPTPREQEQFLA